jgi:hypothetical protein
MSATTQAAIDVLAERQRQISAEGWTPEHDDEHDPGELSAAASAYALAAADKVHPQSQGDGGFETKAPAVWPWSDIWWKPGRDPRRMLVKAGALILAEIERQDRAGGRPQLMQVSTTSVLVGQILVMATLLERALGVVKNVEAEGSDEDEQLQELIEAGEDAIATVLTQHAMQQAPASVAHHPV